MKLDVHGKTWAEAKADFIEAYNKTFTRSARQVVDVVHGYGSTGQGGVIRTRLRTYLNGCSAYLTYQTGEHLDANPGHTVVTPKQSLPSLENELAEEIWDYCSEPRTTSKIMGKFRRHGDPKVQQAIADLLARHRLTRHSDKLSRP